VDDVPAELGLYRLVGQLAFLQAVSRIGERLDLVGGRSPAQIATVGGAARVFRVFLGQVGELGFVALDLGEQVVGGLFVFNQDVADLVFHLAGLLLLDLVVFGLHLLVGDGVLLQVFGHQGAHQDALAGQLDFGLHIGLLGNAVFFGGLHEDLAVDHFLLDLLAQLRRVGGALADQQFHELIQALLRNGLAIDGGGVLRKGRYGDRASRGQHHDAFHGFPLGVGLGGLGIE